MELNERIRYIRKELKMNRDEFAETLGFSSGGVVSNMELGRVEISDERINLICKVHNVNKDWLLNGVGNIFAPASKEKAIADFAGEVIKCDDESFKKRLVTALSKFEDEDWEALERVLDKIMQGK